jgi:acetyl-CoA carboxylase carboxyltransferase component
LATEEPTKIAEQADPYADLTRRREEAMGGGGPDRVAKIHDSGRLTGRERIERLIDPGSWYELGMLAEPELRRPERITTGDGIITGLARLDGRKVAIIAVDATVLTGTTGPVNMRKQTRIAEWAGRRGLPLICLSDNDGGRLPDLLGWRFSGVPFDFATFLQPPPGFPAVPRMTAALGPSFGDAALHCAMGHFVVMQKDAAVALSGPPVIRAAIGEDVDASTLGGPQIAHETSGSVHAVVDDEEAAFGSVKRFLSYLPDTAAQPAPLAAPAEPKREVERLPGIVPREARRGYDMRKVLDCIVDADSLFQWGERYGRSLITAFSRIEGQAVGLVASQPMQRAGVLDVPALKKLASFIDLCDTFNLPLVFLQDVPGLMIGTDAEREGILGGYEGVVVRLARATVPKIAIIVRKAYGGGHIALGGRPVHPDLLLAWPTAEMGFMAPDTGVQTVYRRRLDKVLAEEGREAHDELVAALEAEWAAESEPWEAAANIILDAVIQPEETRDMVVRGIDYAWGSGQRVTKAGI